MPTYSSDNPSVFVIDVQPFSSDDDVILNRDINGVVTNFRSTTKKVKITVQWVEGNQGSNDVPRIGSDNAVMTTGTLPTGIITTTIESGPITIFYGPSHATLNASVESRPVLIVSSDIEYSNNKLEKGVSAFLNIHTTEQVDLVQLERSLDYTLDIPAISGNLVRVMFTNNSDVLNDTYRLPFRVRLTNGFWTAWVNSETIKVNDTGGFTNRTIVMTYPQLIADIGATVTDVTKVVVKGRINSTPPLPIALERVATPAELKYAYQYCIIDGTKIQLDKRVKALYYDATSNISIDIEQK